VSELTTQDFKDVLHVAHKAAQPDTVDGFRRETLHLLEKTLKAEKGNFFLIPDTGPYIDFNGVVTSGIEEKALGLYRRYYNHLDPFAKRLTPESPAVIATQDIVSFKNFVRTEYYNDFLKPQSIHHQMTVYLRCRDRSLGTVALFRSRHGSRFSARDKAKAGLLVAPLAGSLEKSLAVEKLKKRECIIDTIVPDLPYKGIVILDPFLRPVYHNENALGILDSLKPSGKGSPGFLGLLPKSISKPCKDLTAEAESKGPSQGTPRFLTLESPHTGQQVKILMRRFVSREQVFLLLGLEPAEQMLCLRRRLSQHGLSPRELDVVFLLSEGLKNADIGKQLFISPHTVDNHLKSIYRKMKVRNRTSLMSRIMRLDSH
jgi:DNA-binding CsgD family transcriptional regulator